jgi:hypothetical protein
MSNHTPEPWKYTERMNFGDAYGAIVGADGYVIAGNQDYYPVTEENQRRIVACVNACAGIPNEWLVENGVYAIPTVSMRRMPKRVPKVPVLICARTILACGV